jgi:hypothetical protein
VELFESLGRFRHLRIESSRRERFRRSRDSGVGARELRALGEELELGEATFRRYIDSRDLNGDENPWREGCGQAVSKLMEMPSAIVIKNTGDLAVLAQRLDAEIKQLDQLYRAFSA